MKYTFKHMGINVESREEAFETAKLISAIFGVTPKLPEKGSPFAGTEIELCGDDKARRGTHGHIGFYTEDIEEAIKDLESRGIELDHEKAKLNSDGTKYLIYLKQEIAGFAIHLITDKKD